MEPIKGLHHVTAVTRDAQVNEGFYRNVLGQRFVKKTVNFDVPDSYHFYFADEIGTPGTVLTFFVWQNVKRGVRGNGETAAWHTTSRKAPLASGASISRTREYLSIR